MDISIKAKGDGWRVFVPEFNDNRTLAEKDQFSLEIHWLTHGEKKRYAKMVKPRMKGRRLTTNAEEIDRLIFCQNARNITNLSFDGQAVTDSGVLHDSAPSELIEEIVNAITTYGALDEDDEKN